MFGREKQWGLGVAGLAASTSCLSHGTDGSLMNQPHGRYSWIPRASCAARLSPSPPLCVVRLWVRSCCGSLPGERGAEMGWAWHGEGRGRRAVGQHSGLRADAAQRGPSGMPRPPALAWYTTSSMELFITGRALVVFHCHQSPDVEPKGWRRHSPPRWPRRG